MYVLILFRGHISVFMNAFLKYGYGELINVAMAPNLKYIDILKMSKLVSSVHGVFPCYSIILLQMLGAVAMCTHNCTLVP